MGSSAADTPAAAPLPWTRVASVAELDGQLKAPGRPVMLDFYADWCGPCKMMSPIVAELAPEYEGKLKFGKLDTDANPGVSSALQIQSIPTFMIFKGNTVYAMVPGAMRKHDFQAWIDEGLGHMEEHAAELAAEQAAEQASEQPQA